MIKNVIFRNKIVEKFGNVSKTTEGHILVDRRLMFDENEKVVADFAGNIIFQATEKSSFESVNFKVVFFVICVQKRITQIEKSSRIVKIIPKDGIFVFFVGVIKTVWQVINSFKNYLILRRSVKILNLQFIIQFLERYFCCLRLQTDSKNYADLYYQYRILNSNSFLQ